MLKRLYISNFVLIDSLDMEFPDGLIIITGETGAGKSILLGALSLLLGRKADTSVISDKSRNCVVEGEFAVGGREYILRRVLSPSGRSRTFVNDEPASLSQLSEISGRIIDIHAQHSQLLLKDKGFRLSVIDLLADNGVLLSRYNEAYTSYRKTLDSISGLESALARAESEADYRAFQLSQLEEASITDGELARLEVLQKELVNAEGIKNGLYSALAALSSDEDSVVQRLKAAQSSVSRSVPYKDGLSSLVSRMESCRIEIADIEQELERAAAGVEVSPERLAEVEERMSLIYTLMRKHGCSSEKELCALRDSLSESADRTAEDVRNLAALRKKAAGYEAERDSLAAELSQRRKKAAVSLSGRMQELIRGLGMPDACFDVKVTETGQFTQSGSDDADFYFSADGPRRMGEADKVASGGELSRIMLALKGLMAQYTSMPTMIFDEIDTGVSGSIADRMGDMIGKMGQDMQIFAITHLPQIASKKGTHYLVYKETGKDGSPVTSIRKLDYEGRIMEIARMLSGSSLTDAAVENARTLIEN